MGAAERGKCDGEDRGAKDERTAGRSDDDGAADGIVQIGQQLDWRKSRAIGAQAGCKPMRVGAGSVLRARGDGCSP
jgi:hypothetical protein